MKRSSAVSLVELAIVILVLGILAATVSVGSTLVEQAKIQRIMNDVKEYTNALNIFESRYDELPGDMTASSALAWFNVTNKTIQNNETEGDGYITGYGEGAMSFWHMQLAELLDGSYTGEHANTSEVPGVNLGYSRHSSEAGFNFFTLGQSRSQWGYWASNVYNRDNVIVLGFGNIYDTNSDDVCNSALTPAFAHKLDNKFDDGIPNQGNILGDHGVDVGSLSQCTNSEEYAHNYSSSEGELYYNSDDSNLKCRMMFVVKE